MKEILASLLNGFWLNIELFVMTLVLSIPLGLVITFGSMSRVKVIKWIFKIFVWVIRGTPLMLQLFIVLYAPGLLFDAPFKSRTTAALVAFVINYAAYFSEIYRAGIEGVPEGQYEAGAVLGMTKGQTFRHVVLMQVVKRIVPPMSNEVVTLVKDSSLARVIGIAELIMCAERFTKKGLIWPLFSTGLFFLVFNTVVSVLLNLLEKKLDYFRV